MQKAFALADLDVTKKCEEGFEFEVTDEATGKGVGIFLTVIGGHAPAVLDFIKKSLNARRRQEDMAEKRGKKANLRLIEEDIEYGTELTAMRVIAWRGIAEECTRENVIKLCTINPPIKEQILKASEDLANFTKDLSKA